MDGTAVPIGPDWRVNRLKPGNPDKLESNFVSVKQEVFAEDNPIVGRTRSDENSGGSSFSKGVAERIVISSPPTTKEDGINEIPGAQEEEDNKKKDEPMDKILTKTVRVGQIELLDMRKEPVLGYKFIFIYEDKPSRFVILKPLRRDDVHEVASECFDAFAILGPPRILQSSDSRFAKAIVAELRGMWEDLVLVPREAVAASRRDLDELLRSWLIEHPGKTWWEGLRFVQMAENTGHENDKTPYEILFGRNPHAIPSKRLEKYPEAATNERGLDSPGNLKEFSNDIKTGVEENNTVKDDDDEDEDRNTDVEYEGSPESDNSSFNFVNVKSESSSVVSHIDNDPSSFSADPVKNKYRFKCKICQKRYVKLGHLKNHIKAHGKAIGIRLKTFRLPSVREKRSRRFQKQEETKEEQEEEIKTTKSKSSPEERQKKSRIKPKGAAVTKLNGDPLLECNYCQQKFNFPSVLKRHVRSHTNERPYVCQVCNKSFKQLGHLSQHSYTHTDYRSFQCAICGVKYESLDALKAHSTSHKRTDFFLSSSSSVSLRRPGRIHRLFECDTCKKVFTTKSVLERHIFTHTHERLFGCKVCGKRFKQAGHVKSHMLVHTGERRFECTVCSKKFSLSNSLKKHMYVHNGDKPYQCDVCGSRFLEKRNLNGHLMTHTNERPFSCSICGKRYTLADTLRRHISAAHEDGRTYQCEICAKMFKQLAHLYVHKKVHTDERPFQCHLCDKNFKHKNVLKSHLAIHANLRPFECDVCKATFVRKTNLQTHIASAHMNERPYACTICDKRFKQVSHLNGHVIVHSNSMPFQCDFCDRRCNRLDNLKKHMRLHNKNKE